MSTTKQEDIIDNELSQGTDTEISEEKPSTKPQKFTDKIKHVVYRRTYERNANVCSDKTKTKHKCMIL